MTCMVSGLLDGSNLGNFIHLERTLTFKPCPTSTSYTPSPCPLRFSFQPFTRKLPISPLSNSTHKHRFSLLPKSILPKHQLTTPATEIGHELDFLTFDPSGPPKENVDPFTDPANNNKTSLFHLFTGRLLSKFLLSFIDERMIMGSTGFTGGGGM